MKLPLITNIQRYSIHDGDGIRTTVFFKGCPLTCKWCHNPETQNFQKEIIYYKERCVGCQGCVTVCKAGAVTIEDGKADTNRQKCMNCGECVEECFYNARELCGRSYELPALVKLLEKDRAFYETSGGGVTLSGGEVMAQDPDYLEALLKALTAKGISVDIDTCGAVPFSCFQRILPYVDTFLYDIKTADAKKHQEYCGKDNIQILDNLKKLSDAGASIAIRIPVIGGVNDSSESITAISDFLINNKILFKQIHLLPYHNTGSSKFERVGRHYEGDNFYTPDEEHMQQLKNILENTTNKKIFIGG